MKFFSQVVPCSSVKTRNKGGIIIVTKEQTVKVRTDFTSSYVISVAESQTFHLAGETSLAARSKEKRLYSLAKTNVVLYIANTKNRSVNLKTQDFPSVQKRDCRKDILLRPRFQL